MSTNPHASPLAVALFEAFARNGGNSPADHFDRNAAEQWMQQALDECMPKPAAAPADLHTHLLHMLGAKDHEDAGRIIGELHAASMSTPAAPGIDPADPWRGLYAQELMPKLDGVGDYFAVHPDVPEWPDDDERSIAPLIVAQGFTHYAITADYPWDEGEPGEEFDTCAWLANWKPEPPAGEQWRLVMIQDTEDGPAAVYVRPLALIDASPKGDALQDDRFPGGFADAIAYADEMEEGAGRLYEQVIGFEDGSHTGTDMLAAVLRELQSSPKGGSDVKSRFDFCVKHSTFPVRTQDGRHWIMFVATDPAYPNRRSAFPAATPEASIDAAMQATSAEVGS